MGIRGAFAVAAASLLLAGCGAASASTAKVAPPVVAPVVAPQKFTPETAQEFAAITGGTPLKVESRWPCDQPMQISIAAARGWSGEQVYGDMLYAITYLQALGYDVQVVGPSAYTSNMTQVPAGAVTVAVAPSAEDQVALGENLVGVTLLSGQSALVILDASQGGLAPDVILHEFGHVLGLDHREVGSVMSEGWSNSGHFDADETATVICD
jgi:hypothetical protein